jgi:hypothetical protein
LLPMPQDRRSGRFSEQIRKTIHISSPPAAAERTRLPSSLAGD